MAMNQQIWTEAWNRASREELGVHLTVHQPQLCIAALYRSRPAEFREYTIARCSDPNVIMIIKPHVTLDHPDVLRELGLAADQPTTPPADDLTPDLED
jgi:hypothetical protein